ncbi:hypothetical protein [Cyclobacterium xiamenense]|nr:hypothetical protein [Cyclobacterium xiamenense]
MTQLHNHGIRSIKELEEIFVDPDTVVTEITQFADEFPVFMAIRFSIDMNPILYLFSAGEVITSLFARKATKSESKHFFCGK